MNCSICFNIINQEIMTDCNHYFCKECLYNWFNKGHNTCPICRNNINEYKLNNLNNKIIIINKTLLNENVLNYIQNIRIKLFLYKIFMFLFFIIYCYSIITNNYLKYDLNLKIDNCNENYQKCSNNLTYFIKNFKY